MAVLPKFRLYESDGVTLRHTFPAVVYTNAPQSIEKSVVIEGQRGDGCIVIPGGESSWDLQMRGTLTADDYDAIVVAMDALESAVQLNTKYVLKLDKTDSTTYSWNVIRIEPINYPESLRLNYQKYEITLKANAW